MKYFAGLLAVLAAFMAAPAAFAAGSPTDNAYPLTITAQAPIKGGGGTVPYVITVTNTSKLKNFHIAPLVYLDPLATIAKSSAATINTYSPWAGRLMPAWFVGTLWPGQSRTFTVWYYSTVTFPSFTDPVTGEVYGSATAEMGNGYDPFFQMCDSYYNLCTSASVASGFGYGGKGGGK